MRPTKKWLRLFPWLGVQLWVVAMLKQLFPMYWVESAGGLL